MDRRELGQLAESAVARHLTARGYSVVARNVRMQRGELDLVAARDGRLWFVETKCRRRADVGPPHRAVDAAKRRALFSAAREFVLLHGHRGEWGFLVASVVGDGSTGPPSITVSRLAIAPTPWPR
jgi:putative endonuclease